MKSGKAIRVGTFFTKYTFVKKLTAIKPSLTLLFRS